MGKHNRRSKKRAGAKKAGAAAGPLAGGPTRAASRERAAELVRMLNGADSAKRMEACVTISALLEGREGDEAAATAARQALEALEELGAFPALLKRVSDVDQQVRLQASAALCAIAATWRPVCKHLAKHGLHQALVTLVMAPQHEDADIPLLCNALHLLTDMCNFSEEALAAIAAAAPQLCNLVAHDHAHVAEAAARLLHTAMEGNHTLARAVTSLDKLEAVCAREQCESPEALRAQLHALSALNALAFLRGDQKLADPVKVSGRLCGIAVAALKAQDAQLATQELALEAVTNACTTCSDEFEDEAGEQFETDMARQVADAMIASPVLGLARAALEQAVREPASEEAKHLSPRACGLLDNLVQNASDAAVSAMGVQALWGASLTLLSGGGTGVAEEKRLCEELTETASALLWSVSRRAQQLPQGQLVVGRDEMSRLLAAANNGVPMTALANVAGALGALGSVGPVALAEEELQKVVYALMTCSADASLLVAVQALDSLIDVFADESRDALFDKLKVLTVLRANLPRLVSSMQDKDLRMDEEMLGATVENVTAFIEYKTK